MSFWKRVFGGGPNRIGRRTETREAEENESIRDQLLEMTKAGDVDGLIRELRHKNSFARYCVAGGLMDIGPTAAKAIPSLINTLRDDASPDVLHEAAKALIEIRPKAARPLFLAVVGTRNDYALLMMIKILRAIGPEGVPFLVELLKSVTDPLIHVHCTTFLKDVTGFDHRIPEDWTRWFDVEFLRWYQENRERWTPDPSNLEF